MIARSPPHFLFRKEHDVSGTVHGATDRLGNPLDPIVNYARGSILRGTDEEITRMLRRAHRRVAREWDLSAG